MKSLINENVLEVIGAAGVPVLSYTEIMMRNPMMGLQLSLMGAAGAYDHLQDVIMINDMYLAHPRHTEILLHELVHWTGHHTRLARLPNENLAPTREAYSTEEVTAQLGMFKLAIAIGLDRDTHERALLQYLPKFIQYADFAKAERDSDTAVNYLLNMVQAQRELAA